MGILLEVEHMVRKLSLSNGFSVCEFGDQYVTHSNQHRLASELYKELGCKRYEAIDGNGRGSITADLNQPLDLSLVGKFDLVTDFGTGEHVFNQHQVWKSLHDLVKVGGYIAFDRPSKGYEGHCFYCVQPNLLLALAHANSYSVVEFNQQDTTRGTLLRGVFQKETGGKFRVPQQGRYWKTLVVDKAFKERGPDYKSGRKKLMGEAEC